MCRKKLVIAALFISVWGIVGAVFVTTSWGACRIYAGKLCCSEVCAETFLKGVGNVDVNSVAVCVSLSFDVEGSCLNPADNSSNAQGEPFYRTFSICGEDLLSYEDLTGERGEAIVPVCWELSLIEQRIKTGFCPNPNWTLIDWGILGVYVYHAAYKEDKKGNLYVSSALCRKCTIKPGSTFGELNDNHDCGVVCEDLANLDMCKERSLDVLCWDVVSPLFP
jgi:hypothetical protein